MRAPDEVIRGLTSIKSEYEREGWCKTPLRLETSAVESIRHTIDRIAGQQRSEVVHETGSTAVRAIHGCHLFDELCAALVRLPLLVKLAETLLGRPVYVYQFKVNLKQARQGAAWPWHQDYSFWQAEDGMPTPNALNVAISLDDVHEQNGPLVVIPRSHQLGRLDVARSEGGGTGRRGDWRAHVSADLTYTVRSDWAEALVQTNGCEPMLGTAGSINVFHPSIVHSSSSNESADRRALLLITYNAVDNAPLNPTRPAFLVDRNIAALSPAEDARLSLRWLARTEASEGTTSR